MGNLQVVALALLALALARTPASAEYRQQGPKLAATDATGFASQGNAAALSADGGTLIVGAALEISDIGVAGTGAVWAYTRANGVWTQQGNKIVGAGAVGAAGQGQSVAVSADGNTAIIGGPTDDGNTGAAWVFTRTNGVWSQQGNKIVGAGGVGQQRQGQSVALSADGNTAVVGGSGDNSNAGAAWVFSRANGVWTQQGVKLVGAGAAAAAQQGFSVAISADGATLAIGGPGTAGTSAGATWIFTRSGSVWTQEGNRLVGAGASSPAAQGVSVALSANGDTVLVGGFVDNVLQGAAWVFTRASGVWTQQGNKLVGAGATGAARQGVSVALSANGNTAIVGGSFDSARAGAAWVFTRSNGVWSQSGAKLVGAGATGAIAEQGYGVALSSDGATLAVGGPLDNTVLSAATGATWVFSRRAAHDFGGDSVSDILLRAANGVVSTRFINNGVQTGAFDIGGAPSSWTIAGAGDFDGDGKADILWRDATGLVATWFMNGATLTAGPLIGNVTTNWAIIGTGDYNGDGKADILWREASGAVAIWLMDGATFLGGQIVGSAPTSWTIVGVGDFDGDGKSDILWRDTSGLAAIWFMNGASLASGPLIANVTTNWTIAGVGDLNGDGKADIVWRESAGAVAVWLMNGAALLDGQIVGGAPVNWTIAGTGDFNNDGKSDILWRGPAGEIAAWMMDGATLVSGPLLGSAPLTTVVQKMGN